MNHLVFLHPRNWRRFWAGTKVVEKSLVETARHPCRYALVGDRLYFKATGGMCQAAASCKRSRLFMS